MINSCDVQVHIQNDETHGPPIDYTKDYRRFSYKDFAFDESHPDSSISPEILLRCQNANFTLGLNNIFSSVRTDSILRIFCQVGFESNSAKSR